MGFIEEFKAFINRGNVLELAVGFIMGVAFKDVVNALVNDILMPPIGLLVGGINFDDLKIVLASSPEGEVAIAYGHFISVVIEFLLIAFSVFLVVKLYNKFKKKEEEKKAPPKKSPEVALLEEIRDLLKKKA